LFGPDGHFGELVVLLSSYMLLCCLSLSNAVEQPGQQQREEMMIRISVSCVLFRNVFTGVFHGQRFRQTETKR
jgi:hypothetical protein